MTAIEGVTPLKIDGRVTRHSWHLFIFRYDADSFGGLPRDRFLEILRAEGIPCMPGYIPLHRNRAVLDGIADNLRLAGSQVVDNWNAPDCPVAEQIALHEAVWIPQNVLLGDREDMDSIVVAIAKIKQLVQQ